MAAGFTLAVTPLAACGSDVIMGDDSSGGGVTLTWYAIPDPTVPEGVAPEDFGQLAVAGRCSTDEYTIEVQTLPSSASEQRIQLARRLAAEDPSIDLMTLDPPFVAEFADAGFLAPVPDDLESEFTDGVLQGAIDGATWEDELVAVPWWANTQLLWYRKSMAEAAGLDMTQPVTWDEIIDAAVEQKGTVGVQANKYEGYVVWINALISGAGGDIVSDTAAGADASIDIDSEAGVEAARIIQKLAGSAAAEPDLSVSNEGTVLGPFADPGGFQVNWTFIYNNYKGPADAARETEDTADDGAIEVFEDMGWARYPQTDDQNESTPPIGGGDIAVSNFSENADLAYDAAACITSAEEEAPYAVDTGNMPADEAAYEAQVLTDVYPADLLALFRESIDAAGPRPPTPYWSSIVLGILSQWHPADSVDPDSTPQDSAEFIKNVLSGDSLV